MITVKFDFIRNQSANETAAFSRVLDYEFFYGSEIIPWWAKTFRLETLEHSEFTINQINASAVEAQNISMENLQLMYPLQAKRAWNFGEYNLHAAFAIDAKHFIAYPDPNGNVDTISLMQKFTNKHIHSQTFLNIPKRTRNPNLSTFCSFRPDQIKANHTNSILKL